MTPTTNTIITAILVILTGIAVLAGCNKEGIPGLVRCEGIVTWKGEPVEGAHVALSPNGQGRSASGITNAAGKFKATTLHADDGIMPGEYVVTITKVTTIREGGPEEFDPMDSRENRRRPAVQETVTQTHFIPQIYADRTTSGLSATISSKGTKDLLFELVGEIANRPTR